MHIMFVEEAHVRDPIKEFVMRRTEAVVSVVPTHEFVLRRTAPFRSHSFESEHDSSSNQHE